MSFNSVAKLKTFDSETKINAFVKGKTRVTATRAVSAAIRSLTENLQ